jgi:hypothetical protein
MTREVVFDHAAGALAVGCVWCGQATRGWPERMFQGNVNVCPCGAQVLFAPPHDFDEAAEELLQHLKIDGDVAEPARAVGTSGLVAVRAYDGARSRRQLAAILEATGCETLAEDAILDFTSPLSGERYQSDSWGLWWRPRGA